MEEEAIPMCFLLDLNPGPPHSERLEALIAPHHLLNPDHGSALRGFVGAGVSDADAQLVHARIQPGEIHVPTDVNSPVVALIYCS